MGVHLRPQNGSDSRFYSPDADISHNFTWVAETLRERLIGGRAWGDVRRAMSKYEASDEEIAKAVAAYSHFVASAADSPRESMQDALVRSGWFECTEPAQFAVMAALGKLMSCLFFTAARAATFDGEGPCTRLDFMRHGADSALKAFATPRWQRPFVRLKVKLVRAWSAFRGQP